MQPVDLNLTTTIVGHQLFLFVTFGVSPDTGGADGEMAEALKLLGHGMENIHDVDGPPTDKAFKKGRYQFLRAETALTSSGQVCWSAWITVRSLWRIVSRLLGYTSRHWPSMA